MDTLDFYIEAKIIEAKNALLYEIVEHNYFCQHCKRCDEDHICFFAYPCLTQDFHYYEEDD